MNDDQTSCHRDVDAAGLARISGRRAGDTASVGAALTADRDAGGADLHRPGVTRQERAGRNLAIIDDRKSADYRDIDIAGSAVGLRQAERCV